MWLMSMLNGDTSDDNLEMDVVHIAPKVIESIKRNAVMYLEAETGEAMVGVMHSPSSKDRFPKMYVLDTIAPRAAVRQWAMFEQGGEWEESVFHWLNENWQAYRVLRRRSYGTATAAKWDLPLIHLGDWHKQPGGMVEPSGGDLRTAKRFLKDNELDFLLAPIVTLADEATHQPERENTLVFRDVKPPVRIDFWGIGKKHRDFIPLKPETSALYGLPRLPEKVWWLQDEQRMDLEMEALEKSGLQIMDKTYFDADGMPPLETCFVLYRPGAYQVILAITAHTYPKKPPQWRLAPIKLPEEGQDFFKMLFETSTPVAKDVTQNWSGDVHALIDGVRMIEASLV